MYACGSASYPALNGPHFPLNASTQSPSWHACIDMSLMINGYLLRIIATTKRKMEKKHIFVAQKSQCFVGEVEVGSSSCEFCQKHDASASLWPHHAALHTSVSAVFVRFIRLTSTQPGKIIALWQKYFHFWAALCLLSLGTVMFRMWWWGRAVEILRDPSCSWRKAASQVSISRASV